MVAVLSADPCRKDREPSTSPPKARVCVYAYVQGQPHLLPKMQEGPSCKLCKFLPQKISETSLGEMGCRSHSQVGG